jgi:guanylate kinase
MTGRRAGGTLFVVSAPSGAGKTTLCRRLVEQRENLRFSVSYTTRAPREGEVGGRDYFFVDEEAFRAMAERGEFLEWAEVHGNFYGTARSQVEDALGTGTDVLLDIDVQGARQVRESGMSAVFAFILPPSRAVLAERLSGRGTDPEEVVRGRLRAAAGEIRDYELYDYVIVNDVLETALEELAAVVRAAGLRASGLDPAWVRENFSEEV